MCWLGARLGAEWERSGQNWGNSPHATTINSRQDTEDYSRRDAETQRENKKSKGKDKNLKAEDENLNGKDKNLTGKIKAEISGKTVQRIRKLKRTSKRPHESDIKAVKSVSVV